MVFKLFIVVMVLISIVYAGGSFNKVMAKNRSSKKIGNSNYKVINGNKEYNEAKKNGASIGLNLKDSRVGTAYNYVEIKNVDLGTKKQKRKYGLDNIQKQEEKRNLIGVKAKQSFKGSIRNNVSIKNSNLH